MFRWDNKMGPMCCWYYFVGEELELEARQSVVYWFNHFFLVSRSTRWLWTWKRFTARPKFVPTTMRLSVIYRSILVRFQLVIYYMIWLDVLSLFQLCFLDLTAIMKSSRDEEELRHVWTQWRNVTGRPIKHYYERFVELSNEAAQLNSITSQFNFSLVLEISLIIRLVMYVQTDFSDTGVMWLRDYESDWFKRDIEDIWLTITPFYEEIHAYVRAKLREVYGASIIADDGLIPAHLLGKFNILPAHNNQWNVSNSYNQHSLSETILLNYNTVGNMWAQSWENVYSFTVPFPNKKSVDITEQMKRQVRIILHTFRWWWWGKGGGEEIMTHTTLAIQFV